MSARRSFGLLGTLLLALTVVSPTPSMAQANRTLDPAVTLVTNNISIQANREIREASDFTSFSDSVSDDGTFGEGHADASATATLDIGLDGGLQRIDVLGGVDSFSEGSTPPGSMDMGATIQVNRAVPFTWQFSAAVSGTTGFTCLSSSAAQGAGVTLWVNGPHPSGDCNGVPTQLTTSVSGVLESGEHVLRWSGYAFGPFGSADVQFDTTLILGDAAPIDFDWTMPDRFGADDDGDGLTDYYPPDGNLVIDPGSWQVDFAATDPTYCDPSFIHTWFIDSVEVDPSDPNIISYDPATCDFSYGFPEEAVHEVGFQVTDAQGAVVATADHMVTVQDFLIISIGDSVGSGEGNPDIPKPSLRWENQQCHRSASAGPAQAAKLIEEADPRTSVTLIHLACSGATVFKGLLGPYQGIEPGPLLPPQVDEMRSLVGSREIDAVLVSVGANDVKFSDIITKCFGQADCTDLSDPGSAASFFGRLLPALPQRYDDLAVNLNGGGDPPTDRTYVTEYFDPTRDGSAAVCQGARGILEDAPFSPLGEITAAEATWASTDMLGGLNTTVSSAAQRNGWRFVGGQYSDFATHGYCAMGQRWVVTYRDSQRVQGNRLGTIHPNVAGHADYATHLQASLQLDLYIGGDLTQPRAPAPE